MVFAIKLCQSTQVVQVYETKFGSYYGTEFEQFQRCNN